MAFSVGSIILGIKTVVRWHMTLQEILIDIHSLEEDMIEFERKYGIRSETFYAAYIGGEEPENVE